MMEIIPITKERIKKINILGADISIAFAKYAFRKATTKATYTTEAGWHSTAITYLYTHEELDGIITTRLILWRFKIEVKTVVQYDYSFT